MVEGSEESGLQAMLAAAKAPGLSTLLSPAMADKFSDPAYMAPATERWIAAVQQVLLNQGALATRLDSIIKKLDVIQAAMPRRPGPAVSGAMVLALEEIPMPFVLPDDRTFSGKLNLKDALGASGASLTEAPVYSSADPTLVLTADDADPTVFHGSVNASADDTITGDVQISATCKKPDGSTFVIVDTVTIGAGPAVDGNMSLTLDA